MKAMALTVVERQDYFGKRVFDIFFSLIVLIVLSPLFLLIPLMIRLSSPGEAIFSQERFGKNQTTFKCLKFRTMCIDAEKKLEDLLKADKVLKHEWDSNQKLKNDPRIFAFGKFLRKTSLDELPQFWNVLKGDLSVVGPRPYMVNQHKELGGFIEHILSVRPGITGLWQTSGRSNTSFHTRISLDAEYIEIRSFLLDLSLICKTVPLLLFSKNAC